MKLISMTDFVLEQEPKINESHKVAEKAIESIFKYANFLKQPLTLGMFMPCDEDDKVLIEPLHYKEWCKKSLNVPYCLDLSKYEQYQQAKDRVLFKNVSYAHAKWIIETNTYIDYITSIQRSMTPLTLTLSARKQIGL